MRQKASHLEIRLALPVHGKQAGLLVSRGIGGHDLRVCEEYELIFVRNGTLHLQEEEMKFTVPAGQAVLLWPGRRHWGTEEYSSDLEFFWLHFSVDEAAQAAEHTHSASLLKLPQVMTVRHPDFLAEMMRRYLDIKETLHSNPITTSLLVCLMLCELEEEIESSAPANAASVIAGRAEAYLRTHFHEPLTARLIAEEMPCNPQYLSRIYHQTYGRTLTQAIQQTRIDYARRLLINDNRSIGEISRACGFGDTSYFLKIFKRRMGMTALAFRRLHARNNVVTE
jgi:AraC-like DNA-binding protein